MLQTSPVEVAADPLHDALGGVTVPVGFLAVAREQ